MLFMTLIQSHTETDSEYMQRVEEAFNKYADMVFALAYSRCNANYSDAQDVTGEVFYRLACKKRNISTEEHLKAWLLHVTVNCSKSLQTNAWHRKTEAISETMCTEADDENSYIYDAVMQLPVNIRTAIHLFYYEDYSIEQTAKAMSANTNTVKSWLRRGRERLRELLSDIDI